MSPFKRLVLSVFVTQVLFFIISVSADKSPTATQLLQTSKTIQISKNESNVTTNVADNETILEGGGHAKVSVPSTHPEVKDETLNLGREHEIIVNKNLNQSVVVSTSPEQKVPPAVVEPPETEVQDKDNGSTRHSTPRKGVNNSEVDSNVKDGYNSTVNVTSSTKAPVKKPTVTIPGEDDPSESVLKLNASVKSEVPSNVENSRSQESTQKYVVPIVIVILSVPFVAIIISILYKRGAEWWRYRHYRRMDFLINGMYDN